MFKFCTKIILLTFFLCISIAANAIALTYSIHGLPKDIEENVKALLNSDLKTHELLTKQDMQQVIDNAPSIIEKGVEPYGYFKAVITPRRVHMVDKDPDQWQASYNITLGTPLKITNLTVRVSGPGSDLPEFKTLFKNLPLKQGQIFKMKDYDDTKDKLSIIAAEKGFLAAKFPTHQIIIDEKKYTCNIVLKFDTGSQFYFGPVTFSGSTYSKHFLERYVNFKPGDKYTSQALLDLQKDLNSSVYFSSVSAHPQDQNIIGDEIPILVELKPRKAKHYSFGLGFGTDTGVRGTAGFDWYHITNTGNYFKSFLQLSEVQSTLQARYVIPGKHPATDQYFLAAALDQQRINRNRGTTEKISLGRVDAYKEWQRTLSLSYQFDQYSINEAPYEHTHLLVPSFTLQRSHVDSIIFPRKGYSVNFNALGSIKALASSTNIAQATFDTQWVFSPFDRSRILLRGNLGATAVSDLDKLPLSMRFFAGGAQSVRGYDYQDLGPGRYLLVGSAEYQHQITGNWWGAAFFDAGNAVNNFRNPKGSFVGRQPSSINLAHILKTSAGIGIVYASPVGPIELTLAKPLTDAKKEAKIQFVMGANL